MSDCANIPGDGAHNLAGSAPYTSIPPGRLVSLIPTPFDRDCWDWPGTDKLAVWRATVVDGWLAADRATASDGTTYPTAEAAAQAMASEARRHIRTFWTAIAARTEDDVWEMLTTPNEDEQQ